MWCLLCTLKKFKRSIPWMEDDSGLTALQLWVNRTMEHANEASAMGIDGLMGLHWRTEEVSPQFSALASVAWDITGLDEYSSHPNVISSRNNSYEFWLDFVSVEFGLVGGFAENLAKFMDGVDSFNLPRQKPPKGSDNRLPMFGCPGKDKEKRK